MTRPRRPVQHFLLVFDHNIGELVELIQFRTDVGRAVKAYSDKEKEYEGRPRIEIVLIGSDSLKTVKVTHANYFDGSAPVRSKYLDLPEFRSPPHGSSRRTLRRLGTKLPS